MEAQSLICDDAVDTHAINIRLVGMTVVVQEVEDDVAMRNRRSLLEFESVNRRLVSVEREVSEVEWRVVLMV